MRSLGLILTTVSLSSYAACASSGHRDAYHDPFSHEARGAIRKRNIVYDGKIADSYDFVIVGGGTAGLTLASRLSEDAGTTVLVLEAGDTGDAVKSSIDAPGNCYYHGLLGSSYDWAYKTVPQPGANNRQINWPGGKLLGGSSAVNGQYNVRPSKVEVDTLAAMSEGGETWNWDNLFAAMKKGETFTPPSADIQKTGNIQFNAQSHGTSGPLHVSYPGYEPAVVGTWTDTLANVGIPANPDAMGGEGWNGFIAASSINPTNWTRSYARSAYIDPLPPRANLAILPNSTVTRIVFSNANGNITATSVEYAATRDAPRLTVNVNKEVIVSSGPVGSPHLLMNSGVGPQDVLTAAGVQVVHALPGIGQHLQDHISTELIWTTNVETAGTVHAAQAATLPTGDQSNAFLSYVNHATCYANVTSLLGADAWQSFVQDTASAIDTSASTLVPSQDPTVIAGYKAIYNATASLLSTPIGQVEILLALTGTAQGAQTIAIQAALQHPFSQGRLYINSSNPFDYPVIDPQYFSHPADKVILREGLKLVRKIGSTATLNAAMLEEVFPGPTVQTDDDWDNWVVNQYSTEFHPSCSMAMLPLEQGGVVDANLKIHGISNVRVVDSSIWPIQFSAHMMAPTYGLAEQAANVIRAQYGGAPLPSTSKSGSGSSSNGSGASDANPKQTENTPNTSGASMTRPAFGAAVLAFVAGFLAMH